jgi:hydrogenase maturation protein HypF
VERASKETGVTTVVGAGGCFHNRELSATLRTSLYQRELQFIEARVLPPNDGGLSLGQAWIALRQLENN